MTELNLILSKNGQAQLADGSSTLNIFSSEERQPEALGTLQSSGVLLSRRL